LRRSGLAALLLCLVLVPAARADGDPASDYLLSSAVFLPPDVVISKADGARIVDEVSSAKARGYEIRIAVIGTRYDLGSVGALFRQPRRYAAFLGQELRFVYKGRLLVVMPNGYGASRAGKPWPTGQALVDHLPSPGTGGPALAVAASAAVRRLAAASGVTLKAVTVAPGRSTGTNRLMVGGIVALVLLAGATGIVAAKRRAAPGAPR
jgi:hypothetical protein